MIIVTVGTQLPFDRLVKAMDDLAPSLVEPVFAQVGSNSYSPTNIRYRSSLPATEFDSLLKDCELIVGHAGIGTVLMAQKLQKPIVVMPRLARHGEHRNDHQLATVSQIKDRPGVFVAENETELGSVVHDALQTPYRPHDVGSGREVLLGAVNDFIVGACA
jgi:UDP-N-acetylglucosamine transferase subunit ALG13